MKLIYTIAIIGGLLGASMPAGAADAPAALWNKSCGKDANGTQSCVVEQFAVAMPQKSVVAQIRFFRTPKPEQTGMALTAPLGVLLPPGLSLSVDGSKPIILPFDRCVGQGCEAVAVLDKAALAKFSGGKILTVRYTVQDNKGVDIPIKLEGLSAALLSLPNSN